MKYCCKKSGLIVGMTVCLIAIGLASPPSPSDNTQEYYGTFLGSLNNATYGISGEVWLANATAIQVTNFNVDKQQKQEISFVFSMANSVESARSVYKVIGSAANGVQYSVPIKNLFDKGAHMERMVVVLSKNTIKAWSHFGIVSGKTWVSSIFYCMHMS
ncbi:hypothetical protein DdX_02531 [Ditylenchus destructor]|uniref:Uncharacterized protein n=1 Tax=Ditylenchus destructor TaxID=166010 RepID=A0AAD4NED9_9BILA|nr:hypothetical protein DdX_02531 [Ditylenchus destructor]